MNILHISYYTMIANFRDIKSMLNMILMPILLVLILGTALEKDFVVENIDKTDIILVNEDEGSISKEFEKFLATKEIKDIVNVKRAKNYDLGLKKLKENDSSLIVMLDKNYSKNLLQGKDSKIKLYSMDKNSSEFILMNNFIDDFNSAANTEYNLAGANSNLAKIYSNSFIKDSPLKSEGNVPGAMDYYTITMLVLIIMHGAYYSLYSVSENFLGKRRGRMLATPVPLASHFIGNIIGNIVTVFVPVIALAIFTKLVYKSNWGNNYLEIGLIIFSLSVMAITIGVLVSSFTKNKKHGHIIIQIVIPVMTFFSGGYFKFNVENKIFVTIQNYLPSKLGQKALFSSIYGEYSKSVISCLVSIWAMTILMLVISVALGRRKIT